eukprot:TRINITY_DN6708_c0_g1_i1.p1 TRINITY_DN6708_c0_g1~~TRINITY_DN6708_c0_g1_i1.p1  ORF type:complete len:703 (-),score=192.48 TRINITY_DN6708_c0_g1_i1:79-2187(-)
MQSDWSKVPDESVLEFQYKQHSVKLWIEKILHIKLENEDLYSSLRNGVVLCYLMKELDPRLIPRIQEETSQPFHLKENAEFFVAACEELGVPPYKRFKPIDLGWSAWGAQGSKLDEDRGENMVNVIECIIALAAIVEREYEGAPHFNIVTKSEWTPKPLSNEEKDRVKKWLSKEKKSVGRKPGAKLSAAIVQKKLQLMAGNGVDVNQYTPNFIRLQSLIRGTMQRQEYSKMVRDQAYRDHVAKEILSTETSYVKSLETLIEVWLRPLQPDPKQLDAKSPESKLLTHDQIRGIFSDIEIIHRLNSELLDKIKSRVEAWSKMSRLGDIFVSLSDFLKVYTTFVQNFSNSMSIFDAVKKKKAVATYFNNCKNHPRSQSLDLPSLLIMPVQRIPRYNMLLADLLKHTWTRHPDYEDLNKASGKIANIATLMNERKRDAEMLSRIIELGGKITGKGSEKLTLGPSLRTFSKEGHFEDTSNSDLMLGLLFGDFFLICKDENSGKKLIYKDKIDLEIHEAKAGEGELEWEIVKVAKKKMVYKFKSKDTKDRDGWVTAVNKARKDMLEKKSSASSVGSAVSSKIKKEEHVSAEEELKRRRLGGGTKNSEVENMIRDKTLLESQLDDLQRKKAKGGKHKKDLVELEEKLRHDLEVIESKIVVDSESGIDGANSKGLKRKNPSTNGMSATVINSNNSTTTPGSSSSASATTK